MDALKQSRSTLVDVLWIDGQYLGTIQTLAALANIRFWPGLIYFVFMFRKYLSRFLCMSTN
jgi:hypothetical protein